MSPPTLSRYKMYFRISATNYYIIGICKLCRSEHGAALLEVPISPELQPSAEPIAVREPETSLSSLQEQPSVVRFYLLFLLHFLKGMGKQTNLY